MENDSNPAEQIADWFREVLQLPKSARVTVEHAPAVPPPPDHNARPESRAAHPVATSHTTVTVRARGRAATFLVPKPMPEVRREDVEAMQDEIRRGVLGRHPILGRLFLFGGWWFAFTGLYAMSAVCPFCGSPACVVGVASAGIFGLACAGGVSLWHRITAAARRAAHAVRSRFQTHAPE
ncbi:MAG: hypothetical protein JXB32_15360 [Deltaproteobacteria bacterium]|nr:hypothetical protein [Deltaproteobacteria bacterium]